MNYNKFKAYENQKVVLKNIEGLNFDFKGKNKIIDNSELRRIKYERYKEKEIQRNSIK